MNLIILSSIPDYVLAMIIIEAIIMMALGVFLIVDIIRSRIKAIKKEQKEAEEKRNQAREASISLDSAEDEAYISSGLSELEYLRRMNKEQKEYIELLEKRINLKRELQEDVSNMEYSPMVNNHFKISSLGLHISALKSGIDEIKFRLESSVFDVFPPALFFQLPNLM